MIPLSRGPGTRVPGVAQAAGTVLLAAFFLLATIPTLAILAGCARSPRDIDPSKLTSKRKTSFDHFGTVSFVVVYDDFSRPGAARRLDETWKEILATFAAIEHAAAPGLPAPVPAPASASADADVRAPAEAPTGSPAEAPTGAPIEASAEAPTGAPAERPTGPGDIERFNAAPGGSVVPIGEIAAALVVEAGRWHELTRGAFDPTVANLVDLWAFSPRFRTRDPAPMPWDRERDATGGFPPPARAWIDAFRSQVDFSRIKIEETLKQPVRGLSPSAPDPGTSGPDAPRTDSTARTALPRGLSLRKDNPDALVDGRAWPARLDFGGIAKGFAADRAAEILARRGYRHGYVSVGSSSMRLLERPVSDPGAPRPGMWGVAVSDPERRDETFLTVFGKNTGLSTSGTYDSGYAWGGRYYSHLVDPATGEPSDSEVLSVTVLGPSACGADALSTALGVMQADEATTFARSLPKDWWIALVLRRGEILELFTTMDEGDYRREAPGD